MVETHTPQEHQIAVSENNTFVDEQEPPAEDFNVEAYRITCPQDYVMAFDAGTLFAPEFRDANGNKLDGSTRVVVMKADRRGNKLSEGIAYDGTLNEFVYGKMRNDEDFVRSLNRGIVLNEKEQLHVYVITPSGASTFDSANSRLTLGDPSTSLGKAVSVREKASLPAKHRKAIEQNTK